jgi:hypothetical protein
MRWPCETTRAEPNFLYVGAGKAASSWLFEICREHPGIFVAEAKDIMFFDRYYERGMDWYRTQFESAGRCDAIGEFSHDYFLKEESADRILRQLPDAKILACLREPVDRTFSEYLYDKTYFQFVSAEQYESGMSFEEFARLPRIRNRSDYAVNLQYFYDRFPREQILVEFYEDLQADPRGFARRIFKFLEVDPDFDPPSLYRTVNPARQARSPLIAKLAYRTGQMLRRFGYPQVVGSFKRNPWFTRMLYREYGSENLAKPAIPASVRARLSAWYHRHDDQLSTLIGRPLPLSWQQPAAALRPAPLSPAIAAHGFAELVARS